MLSLINSPVFQNEYKTWKSKIDGMSDNLELQKELSRSLNELVRLVKFLDNQHRDLLTTNNNGLSAQANEAKSKISEIRKSIDSKLKNIS